MKVTCLVQSIANWQFSSLIPAILLIAHVISISIICKARYWEKPPFSTRWAKRIDLSSLAGAKGPASYPNRISHFVSLSPSSSRPSAGASHARASRAICTTSNTRRVYTRGRELRIIHTRTRVTSCPRPNTPCPSTDHPSASPRSIRPTALLSLPFRLLVPTTPGFSSEVHRSPPITRTCHLASPSPWKPPKAPISLWPGFLPRARFSLASSSFAAFRLASCARDKALRARPLLWAGLPSKLTSAISGWHPMSPSPLSSFDLRRRAFPSARVSASLHMIVLKGDADCSLVSSFSLSFRHGAFIGAIEIYAAFHPGFSVFFDVEPRTWSSSFHKNLFSSHFLHVVTVGCFQRRKLVFLLLFSSFIILTYLTMFKTTYKFA